MRFGSVCSGIEAASVAWHPLGWKAAWLAEIEPFPSAVLAHHYPDVPNHGDMTTLPKRILLGEVEAPDLFCGGTPCQAFSVAGLRRSLDDERGNLSLTFCEIANAIDTVRLLRGEQPAIIFWENVPGVLSTADNAFGCFLGALAGEDEPVVAPGGKWANAGCVFGPQRAVAWRTLDAQHFGVAQRRRRVFVVASSRDGFDPASVLLEFDGVRRDTAPRRETREGVAGGVEIGPGGGRFTDLNPTLDTRAKDGPIRNQLAGAVITMAHGQGGAEIAQDRSPTLTCNHEEPIAVYALQGNMIGRHDLAGPSGSGISADLCFTQTKMDVHAVAYGIRTANTSSNGWGIQEEATHTLDGAMGIAVAHSHAVAFQQTADCLTAAYGTKWNGNDSATNGSLFAAQAVAVAFDTYNQDLNPHVTHALRDGNSEGTPAVLQSMAVRRLTPVECERLQGFPDNYTAIPWRKKPASECPDGPRYKALGNSWAVPVVAWIGRRIQRAVA
jgi:DNA (cytosine-5)-methyltransferase 1